MGPGARFYSGSRYRLLSWEVNFAPPSTSWISRFGRSTKSYLSLPHDFDKKPATQVAAKVNDEGGINGRELVVVRALGPQQRAVVALRESLAGTHVSEALRANATLELDPSETPTLAAAWRALGVTPALVLCAPLLREGRKLGAIEVGRVTARARFSDAERAALEYIAEQFADFVAERPLLLDDDAIAEAN